MTFWKTLESLLATVLLQQGTEEQPISRFTPTEEVCIESAHISLEQAQEYPEWYDGCAIALLASEGILSNRAHQYGKEYDAYDVRYFVYHGISPKKAKKHFRHGQFSTKAPFSYAYELAQLTDAEKLPLYRGSDLNFFLDAGIQPQEIIELSALRDGTGMPLLNAHDILGFKRADGTLGYARNLYSMLDNQGNPLLTGFQIFRYAQLSMKKEEIETFQDTKKPNAIVIFPAEDYNEVFQLESVTTLFQKIKETYDVWVRFAITEQDVYDALLYVPDAELLVIGGHGSTKSLSLGGEEAETAWRRRGGGKKVVGRGKQILGKREEYFIDVTDKEMGIYLSQLDPHATIFLISCSTGNGGTENNNLATFISDFAGERKVFASQESFTPSQIKINSLYPFDINIVKDVTYSNK